MKDAKDPQFAQPKSKVKLSAEDHIIATDSQTDESSGTSAESLASAGSLTPSESLVPPDNMVANLPSVQGADKDQAGGGEPPAPPSTKKSGNVGKQFGVVAGLTVISKAVGFARDVLVAKVYGTAIVADAYNFAYQFTGSILILFGGLGGPFHSSTLSLLAGEKDDPEKAGLLVTQVMVWTALILGAISLLLYFAAPYIVHYWPYAHVDPSQRALFEKEFVMQLQWMCPLILISGVIGISYGVLNAYGKIFWPSISPLIASVSIILGLLYYQHERDPLAQLTAVPLAIATMIGAIGQMLAQVPDLFKCKLKWRLVFKPSPLLIQYLKMLIPACFATLIGTLTTYVDMFFTGSIGPGGWTAITTSNRLVQLPLGILATAMLVPMLPRFAEKANEGDSEAVKTDYKKALQFMIFLSMPITTIMLCLPEPVTRVLFKRGAFTEDSVHLVAIALIWLAPQIVFYLGRDLITRVFFAYKDTRTPFAVAMIAIAVKFMLDWLFVVQFPLGVGGISLATTLITIMNLTLLHMLLRKRIGSFKSASMFKPLATITLAGAICGAVAFGTYKCWDNFAAFSMPTAGHLQIEKAHLVPARLKTSQTDAQTNAEPVAVIAMESNECLVSLVLGVGLSCAAGLAAYLAVCIMARLEEINMLTKRLPGMKKFQR